MQFLEIWLCFAYPALPASLRVVDVATSGLPPFSQWDPEELSPFLTLVSSLSHSALSHSLSLHFLTAALAHQIAAGRVLLHSLHFLTLSPTPHLIHSAPICFVINSISVSVPAPALLVSSASFVPRTSSRTGARTRIASTHHPTTPPSIIPGA